MMDVIQPLYSESQNVVLPTCLYLLPILNECSVLHKGVETEAKVATIGTAGSWAGRKKVI